MEICNGCGRKTVEFRQPIATDTPQRCLLARRSCELRNRIKVRWSVQILKDTWGIQGEFRHGDPTFEHEPVKTVSLEDLAQVLRDGPRQEERMAALAGVGRRNSDTLGCLRRGN